MTTELERTLSQIQAQIHRARITLVPEDRRFLEHRECVRSQLVAPILDALGWNTADADEVRIDFRLEGREENSGLALFLSGTPCFLVDLRGLAEEFDRESVMNDLLPRAGIAGFEWVLLTDGDDYEVYNAHLGLPAEQRAFDAVRLSLDPLEEVLELFGLLSKERLRENRIESQWRCQLIDRQVKESLEDLLAPDSSLVELLYRETSDLSSADIRCSLSRVKAEFGFEYGDRTTDSTAYEVEHELECATGMSEAELRIATWLQRRSIERWAKGSSTLTRNCALRRRTLNQRRSSSDRRCGPHDRRVARVARAEERRAEGERRSNQRRRCVERRVNDDRRQARRRA
jgi:hypothetical protein